ncbi:hypothetical protein Q9L58_006340 [Maublancomyces gigas]|uniref:L-ornithine N(5)-oxygenase n=1 Tax=Discina gigas TaxID=1032678 RepID=A0ABR3GFN3_9PEZI
MSSDDFVPAERLFAYIQKYAEKFQLLDCVCLNGKAYKIEKAENSSGWNVWIRITVNGSSGEDPLYCDKLILAIGLASWADVPSLPRDEFKPPTFYSQEPGVRRTLFAPSVVSRVTVYGGGKSALDVVGTCVGLGKHVDWIIRRTGSGAPVLKLGYLFGVNSDSFIGSLYASKWHLNVYSCKDGWYQFFQWQE